FTKSDISIIQDFFMKFGKEFLKKDLSQYYTPLPVVKFISSILDIRPNQLVIDPAGGSADFLVDISEDAHKVAHINMILHGDGRGKMKVLDSIEEYDKMNEKFDFCITNPPFGDKTLGILFIERTINLLKEGGILVIILPSGYLNNQSLKYIREYLLKYTIVADISLPEGVFKGAGTGVKTDILIMKKEINPPQSYKIFVSSPKKLGFNYRSKKLEPIYKIDENSGEYLQSSENTNIPDDELNETVAEKFKKFCCDENLEGFEKCKAGDECNSKLETYDFLRLEELKKDENYKLKPEFFLNSFREHVNKLADKKAITLRELLNKGETISVENKRSIEVEDSSEYWQSIKKYDICLSYLLGSRDKFFMMLEDETDNIVVTNGFYRVRINNESHIQTNIVPERVWDFRFPLLSEEEVKNWKDYLVKCNKSPLKIDIYMPNDLELFFEDLKNKGITADLANHENFCQLQPEEKVIYLGIDCTAESLHIGHLFLLFQTIRFARERFRVLLVLGGATSKIGDPSDKLQERPQLASEKLVAYERAIKSQLERILFAPLQLTNLDLAPLETFYANQPELLENIYRVLEIPPTGKNAEK
ncbi:4802_t:CDS:2, partial [Racocetra persica]